jgi:hypothetical protein
MLTRNFDQLSKEVEHHVACDAIQQGSYWDGSRGCFIGCLAHSSDPTKVQDTYGLPIMLQRIAENIFESLPLKEAQAFFAALPTAVGCDNKDLSKVGWQFLASELRSLPPQPAEITAVIEPVVVGMDLLAAGQEWPAATADAAYAAATATATAAAAYATAAYAAADAARLRQRDLLLRLITEAPIVPSPIAP